MNTFEKKHVPFGALSILVLLAFSIPAIAQDDITILINGQPLGSSYTFKPGQQLQVTTRLEPGVLVKQLSFTSDNQFYQDILQHALESAEYYREAGVQEHNRSVDLPPTLPSGTAKLSVSIAYDKNFVDQTFTASTTVDVPEGSFLLRLATKLLTAQAATELVNWLTDYHIPRANPAFTLNDIRKEDLDALGLSPADFLHGLALLQEAELLRQSGKLAEADAKLAASKQQLPTIVETGSKETTPQLGELEVKAPKTKQEIEGSITPSIALTSKTYKVTSGSKDLIKSKLHISVLAPHHEGISQVGTVALIPKEIASTASELTFAEQPTILERDPVVKWAFKNIPQDQAKDYTFTVDKNVQDFEVLAAASAERPSLMFRFIKWLLSLFITK